MIKNKTLTEVTNAHPSSDNENFNLNLHLDDYSSGQKGQNF